MSDDPAESQQLFFHRSELAQSLSGKQGSSSSFSKWPCKKRTKPCRSALGSSGGQQAPTGRLVMCIRERERRRSFRALLADLMALLPSEALQGKKSMAERIGGAADYVGSLKNSISQLSEETKHLRTHYDRVHTYTDAQPDSKSNPSAVEIRRIGPCLEVSIRVSKGQILASEIFLLLDNYGLQTITACSSEIGCDEVLHVIITKIADVAPVNLQEVLLQYLLARSSVSRTSSTVTSLPLQPPKSLQERLAESSKQC